MLISVFILTFFFFFFCINELDASCVCLIEAQWFSMQRMNIDDPNSAGASRNYRVFKNLFYNQNIGLSMHFGVFHWEKTGIAN